MGLNGMFSCLERLLVNGCYVVGSLGIASCAAPVIEEQVLVDQRFLVSEDPSVIDIDDLFAEARKFDSQDRYAGEISAYLLARLPELRDNILANKESLVVQQVHNLVSIMGKYKHPFAQLLCRELQQVSYVLKFFHTNEVKGSFYEKDLYIDGKRRTDVVLDPGSFRVTSHLGTEETPYDVYYTGKTIVPSGEHWVRFFPFTGKNIDVEVGQ